MGLIDIEPHEIAVIPRGVRFQVTLPDGEARLRLRKLWRDVEAARPRRDRLERFGQSTRLL